MSGSGAPPRRVARNAAARIAVRAWCIGLTLAAVAAAGASAQMSVPPARYDGPRHEKSADAAPSLLLPRGAPARRIELPPPGPGEGVARKAAAKAGSTAGKAASKSRRLAVGYARPVPVADAVLRLSELPWQAAADGMRAAQVTLTSPGAAAVRIGLSLEDAPPGLVLRFQGSGGGATAFGPVAAAALAAGDVSWSPVLEGEAGTIEFALPADADPGAAIIRMETISHLVAAGNGLRAFESNIGLAGACEMDIACLDTPLQQQLASATNAVARMVVTIAGSTYLCSGTLLNDAQGSFTPYFLTADHCVEDTGDPVAGRGTAAASAATINTYWFFQAATCGSLAVPAYKLLAGGAKLLARSLDADWALVQLNLAPPVGTTFSAWSADAPVATGTAADGIHHPSGDLKKFSMGSVAGYQGYSDGSSFIRMLWTTGVTEPGSSGSGLFTLNAAAGHYELRGSLSGGASSCTDRQGIDEYARFDAAFPLLKDYLAPSAASATAAVVEYYNALQDQYFLTIDPFEIAGRDHNVPPGWVRTGYRFLAYTDPSVAPAGVQPVCRLYAPPPYGDTRFYSASLQECAAMLARTDQHWIAESAAAFYLQAPGTVSGQCPAGTRAVYRFLNVAGAPHRRYTAEVDLRDALLVAGGWTQEGAGRGSDRAAMCAPPTNQDSTAATAPANYEGLWWNAPAASESGWGIAFTHQADTIFATWFTYGFDGKPLWFAATLHRQASGEYSGGVVTVTGPPFYSVPFDPSLKVATVVGSMSVTFTDVRSGTLSYSVYGVAQTKIITRQEFASPVPTCVWGGLQDLSLATNFQDLWWAAPAGSESGWGITLAHQGDIIFATWFTYGADGSPWWLVGQASKTAPGVYAGNVTAVTGPPFNALPWDPAKVRRTVVGTMTLAFADGNNATFASNVNGIAQTKAITRQVFAPPAGTVCR
jgi:lysyl endopeptidase